MQITVTDTRTYLEANGPQVMAMVIRNTGANTIYFGWEDTTVAAAGANQGVPLEPDEMVAFAGRDIDVGGRLFLVCAATETSTLNFTKRN
jgi:membrane-bound lytic murein transglycosylase